MLLMLDSAIQVKFLGRKHVEAMRANLINVQFGRAPSCLQDVHSQSVIISITLQSRL